MATSEEMGEIDEMHKEEGESIINGGGDANEEEDSQSSTKKISHSTDDEEIMEVDEENDVEHSSQEDEIDEDALLEEPSDREEDDHEVRPIQHDGEEHEEVEEEEEDEEEAHHIEDDDEELDGEEEEGSIKSKEDDGEEMSDKEIANGDGDDDVTEIIDDDDDEEDENDEDMKNGLDKNDEPIELNDSGDGEADGDIMIIEEPKENGSLGKRLTSDELEVIELDSSPMKKKAKLGLPPRRSTRNMNKSKTYAESERELLLAQSSEESDIEEVFPQDPLAMSNDKLEVKRVMNSNSSTIVVKDTKRLVEIAAKSNHSNMGNKKEPTLVIIDTNSILSGRGPVPMNKSSSSSSSQYTTLLPMALPAQGMYPPNMRATITPIPMNSSSTSSPTSKQSSLPATTLAPVLPTLTDDMFVVEAPSFIVPYVYEKPPMSDFKDFLKDYKDQLTKERDEEKKGTAEDCKEDDKEAEERPDSSLSKEDKDATKEDSIEIVAQKKYSYFDSPLGKFFIDIGFNLVQEYVQTDLLKQQKRKRDREGGQNPATDKTIHSLIKNLEFSRENNEPFKKVMKKCEFCNFKTESALVMAHHLETPHTKNYVYKCNFCVYEARSPHDILFHTEAEHAVRGRLERAPYFHQCPNCPFEDNQKGKLSRHQVACARKFKPEKNLDPPVDWEPPAKIPRVPKSRQGINVSAYQAMKSSQLQFLSKMQLLNNPNPTHPLHRGRGRPSLNSPAKGQSMLRPNNMVYKQTMTGGSVLVPTNYQQSQSKSKSLHQPSISITPLPRASSTPNTNITSKPGDTNSKNSFVICEICDGYIKDLEQLRNHMQWIHKVKIHPKMIYNRPPLNCQKCQFRFFTDQGLERHLLGSHGLVTSSMQDAANKSKDAGRCPVCGRVYQWKLLNHVARDHNMTLKPAHLSYKCTVCTATFGMYKQFENHVYSAHSVVAKRVMDKKNSSAAAASSKTDQMMKPLKINDEITIIPQPAKASAGTSKEDSPSSSTGSTNSRNSTPSTSKNTDSAAVNITSVERASCCDAKTAD